MNIYADILSELNNRGVVRTYNSPIGDYAEWLVADKFGMKLVHNSQKGFDALSQNNGLRYQIKSRWERGEPCVQSRTLNVIRNFNENQFDYLIAIIFDEKFTVKEAYIIPHDTIRKYAKFNKHQNGYILCVMGYLLTDADVKNITSCFR